MEAEQASVGCEEAVPRVLPTVRRPQKGLGGNGNLISLGGGAAF